MGETAAAASTRPNIVVILTDDQRSDTVWAMPNVQSHLVAKGITFREAFVSNSICCPARATFLTGNYAHTTGVYSNRRPFGNVWGFREGGAERSTIATWLRRGGYHTSYIGKYFNTHWRRVAPGWDEWRALTSGRYESFVVDVNGVHRRVTGRHISEYLAERATGFIRRRKGKAAPFFLYLSTPVPHAPATPLPRHAGAFSDLPPYESPAFNEEDVSDKPAFIRGYPLQDPATVETWRRRQLASLLGADEMVGSVFAALEETGQLTDTIVVYTSDNGLAWGDHRLKGLHKAVAYESSIRVPFIVRYDRLLGGVARVEDRLVSNADLAPTLAALAGVRRPAVEGRSLRPLLANTGSTWRNAILLENQGGMWAYDAMPAYCGVRFSDWKYVLYASGEEELYDLALDPFELDNRAGAPAYENRRLEGLAAVRRLCFPAPPGFQPAKLFTLRGSSTSGTLLGGGGDDVIRSIGRRDVIRAGAGSDAIHAQAARLDRLAQATFSLRKALGPGRRIHGGPGNDRINTRNGYRDVVRCGAGQDVLVAERFDVWSGCERVRLPYRR